MAKQHTQENTEKLLLAHEFANQLVRIENDMEAVVSLVFNGFHNLGFRRVRMYRYHDAKCTSWRCCQGHAQDVMKRFNEGNIILSLSAEEPDNFASMEGEKTPLIIVYDPECDRFGKKQDERGRNVFITNTDPWYEDLGKPKLESGETFEWLDCPLLVGRRIIGKITMDCCSPGVCFTDADLALIAPLSFLVAAALERNPSYQYDVFVSFQRTQRCLAQMVAASLERWDLKVFLAPEAIPAGTIFEQVIREALLKSEHIVVLFSRECEGNDWVYAECSTSWLLDKKMTVFRVDGVEVTKLPFFMRNLQSPDFTPLEIDKFADGLRRSRGIGQTDSS